MRTPMRVFILSLLILAFSASANGQLTINFPSKDGLSICADWYPVSEQMPVILLCHQNKYSRGEFLETALRLNKFGFNCLAIDQRVGEEVNGVLNETAARAKKAGQSPSYADAEQDIAAAIDFLYEKYRKQIILLGSSYSASLALKLANGNNKVLAVMAFSPGEYFQDKNYIQRSLEGFNKPLLVTSSRAESEAVTDLLRDVNSVLKIQYVPKSAGDHGSKVLWPSYPGNEEYWLVVMNFLDKLRYLD